jgi:GTP-binding protein EngB required for normal cell division
MDPPRFSEYLDFAGGRDFAGRQMAKMKECLEHYIGARYKLVSLVNTQHYVRHRDIWDLRWLKQAGAAINHEWVNNKIDDYRVDGYYLKLENLRQRLPEIIHGEGFKSEMARFLIAG